MPHHHTVITTEFASALLQKFLHRITSSPPIIKGFVAHHHEATGVVRGRPCKLLVSIERVAIAQLGSRGFTPGRKRFAKGGPLCRLRGCQEDVAGRIKLEFYAPSACAKSEAFQGRQ